MSDYDDPRYWRALAQERRQQPSRAPELALAVLFVACSLVLLMLGQLLLAGMCAAFGAGYMVAK